MSYLLILLIKKRSSNLLPSLFFRPTFKKHIFKEVDECNGTITNFHKVLLILVIFGTKECYFSDCTNKKNKKFIFGIKECYFSDCTNKKKQKIYFWDKRVLLFWLHKQKKQKIYFWDKRVLLFWLHRQTNKKKRTPKKNPKTTTKKKKKKKKPTHTIVGREKWLLYFQV